MSSRRSQIVFLYLTLLCATSALADAPAGSVSGVVVDAEKKGVAGVQVSIYAPADLKSAVVQAESGADGKFVLSDVPPGKAYIVKAIKRKSVLGVRAEKSDVTVESGKVTDVGNLELKVPSKK